LDKDTTSIADWSTSATTKVKRGVTVATSVASPNVNATTFTAVKSAATNSVVTAVKSAATNSTVTAVKSAATNSTVTAVKSAATNSTSVSQTMLAVSAATSIGNSCNVVVETNKNFAEKRIKTRSAKTSGEFFNRNFSYTIIINSL
jgi:hypothetical protein